MLTTYLPVTAHQLGIEVTDAQSALAIDPEDSDSLTYLAAPERGLVG